METQKQQRDARGHFLPTPGSPRARIAELEGRLIQRAAELEGRLIQRAAELGRAKDKHEADYKILEETRKIANEKLRVVEGENKLLADEVKHLTDKQSLTADELGAAIAQVETMEKQLAEAAAGLKLSEKRASELVIEKKRLLAALSQAGKDIEQERRAGWVETRTVGIVTAVVVSVALFLIGRWGR